MDKKVYIWNSQTGEQIRKAWEGHTEDVMSVAFSGDGSRVVSTSLDGTLRQWNVGTGGPVGNVLEVRARSAAFSHDDRRIIAGVDGVLWMLDTERNLLDGAQVGRLEKSVSSLAFSPVGQRLVSGSRDRALRLWDSATLQLIDKPVKAHGVLGVTSIALSLDGTRLVSGGGGQIRLWNATTLQPIGRPVKTDHRVVKTVAFSPNGKVIASAGEENRLRLWDVERDLLPISLPLEGHEESAKGLGEVTSVAFSPDGKHITSGDDDGNLRLWDAKTGKSIGDPFKGHENSVTSLAFRPDGRRIVSGSVDGSILIWNAESNRPIGALQLKGHSGSVSSVAFNPDGTRIASVGDDGMLRLWEAMSGKPIGPPIKGYEKQEEGFDGLTSVAFSPDGTRIATGGGDTTLRLWPAPKVWPELLCTKLVHNMSHKEWREQVSPDIKYLEQCPGFPILPDAP